MDLYLILNKNPVSCSNSHCSYGEIICKLKTKISPILSPQNEPYLLYGVTTGNSSSPRSLNTHHAGWQCFIFIPKSFKQLAHANSLYSRVGQTHFGARLSFRREHLGTCLSSIIKFSRNRWL